MKFTIKMNAVTALIGRLLCAFAVLALCGWTHGTPSTGGGPNVRQQNIFGVPVGTSPTVYYNPPGISSAAISTADHYHMGGLYWFRPYDLLDPACGSVGASYAASRGRYFWSITPDHPVNSWSDEFDLRGGFSGDPGAFPAKADVVLQRGAQLPGTQPASLPAGSFTGSISGTVLTVTAMIEGRIARFNTISGAGVTPGTVIDTFGTGVGGTGTYNLSASQTVASTTISTQQPNPFIYHIAWLVCNPDDAAYPFWFYSEGQGVQVQHETFLLKCADLEPLADCVFVGPSHPTAANADWSSFQRVVRSSKGSWYSTGLNVAGAPFGNPAAFFANGKWTSTDGRWFDSVAADLFNTCLPVSSPTGSVSLCSGTFYSISAAPDSVSVGGQAWSIAAENTGWNGTTNTAGQFITRAPIDSNFNVLTSPSPVRISNRYAGQFPGPTYLQTANAYVEDGIIHHYASVGFPQSAGNFGLVNKAPYLFGGGLWEQQIDYYTEVADASAALQAAPVGVTISCTLTCTISWYDALPKRTYRVYKGSSAGAQATLVGDVTGTSITDTPTANQQWWYKVVTMEGATERKSRVVHMYVGDNPAFVNKHVNRVTDDGGANIDIAWTSTFYTWLVDVCVCFNNLEHWVDAGFGVKKNGSNQIEVIYNLGATRLPRGGDLRPRTAGNNTWNATALNNTPAWVNASGASQMLFGDGRVNNVRRKIEATLFSAFSSAGDVALIGQSSALGGYWMLLERNSGNAAMTMSVAFANETATAALGGDSVHIIGGTFGGGSLKAYVNGSAGTANTNLPANTDLQLESALRGQYLTSGFANTPFLQHGARQSQTNPQSDKTYAYTYSDNTAVCTCAVIGMLDKDIGATLMGSLTTLYRNRLGP